MAFKTLAKINSIASTLQPGDQVLLRAGLRYTDDYIRCQNLVKAAALTTLTTNPPTCSGTADAPIVFGKFGAGSDPIIDAADQLTGLTWQSLGNGVYSTPLAIAPQKLFIDKTSETPQLIPVPNYVGEYDTTGQTVYQPWDAVTNAAGITFMNGINMPQKATIGVLGLGGAWVSPYAVANTPGGTTHQEFIVQNTGLQNVQAIGGGSVYLSINGGTGYPASFTFSSTGGGSQNGVSCQVAGTVTSVSGVPVNSISYTVNQGCSSVPVINVSSSTGTGLKFYGRVDSGTFYYASTSQNGALAKTLYVHLQDGSDPSRHVFYATHRPYGILLRGVNNVSVTHIQFAHQLKSGVLSYPYADTSLAGQYWTNEGISVSHATCWNTGDTVQDILGWAGGTSRVASLEGCVVLRAAGETNPHLVRGDSISDSWSGLIDVYYGRIDQTHANFMLSGLDGTRTVNGVTSSYPLIQYSYGRSHNSACIQYGYAGINRTGYYLNKGGLISNNECTDNSAGNIFFGGTAGGGVSHNFIHDSLGQGIQGGGFSTSVPDPTSVQAQTFDHNVISNLGVSATFAYYDGIDLNNGYEGSAWPFSSDMHVFNNTIFNTADACMTMEMNIVTTHLHDNVCVQASNFYPAGWICPVCATTMNYAAGIYVRKASTHYAEPMDWHNNAWENQYASEPNWVIYNAQASTRGSCKALTLWPPTQNPLASTDLNSFCTSSPGFSNPATSDFTLSASSPLRATGTSGGDIGAIPYGQAMFHVGPR
ncbi:right-handed parallel beta-helix repeat-containing protein [Granulicella sibirica]|nr:right-handed parallel beta-helix repeat-containing protein [Granulicella sibirica]